jgi:2-oxoglutarate dehydrogenase E2 component (dihydrolipoamide succinyltransferase)
MAFDVQVPPLGESVTEGTISRWAKKDGEQVRADEVLLELETDKAGMEIAAERGGVLRILKPEGTTVNVGDVIARIEDGAASSSAGPAATSAPATSAARPAAETKPAPAPASAAKPAPAAPRDEPPPAPTSRAVGPLSPAVRRLVTEHELDPGAITATGRGGRLTKEDVVAHIERGEAAPAAGRAAPAPAARTPAPMSEAAEAEERVPMTRIRKRIAERLVQAQQTAAILTTFNEIDMSAVMTIRAAHKERFQKLHGVPLGFMSFFSRACVLALEEFKVVNAEVRGDDIVYKHYVHLGIAVGSERGLVVPVVRHAERMTFADLEREIGRLAGLARDGKLTPDDLAGGTFTISNGGIYGSLMSTPILNPPQSGILGMHKIEKRPVVVNDQVAVRPMMYVALSYDHRIVDGEQAVSFLVRVKERLEDPARLLLDV